ncbi:uncharacterized protein LOC100892652 isoform X1 [Strongylocentrotus purpuratus]|uniref:Cyclic nucleotide-binding domain-containing protein n=1 Tax=Strongylocentrotus purpuratus TaxID=7668 RepID=A0A7M7N0F3_STRPU|nr:uncharacterized protein LOC100892652 isoform X1 [Strongylocentrotus purpuratus]
MMAAELPRGRGRHRGTKQRKDPTIKSMTETTTTRLKPSMDLPALIRTGPPQGGIRHVRLSLGGVSKFRQASKSMPDAVVDDFETKRRQKLRGVIAMMEMSKRPVKRKNDVETHLNETISENVNKQQRKTNLKHAKTVEASKRRTKQKGNNRATKGFTINVTNDSHNEEDNDAGNDSDDQGDGDGDLKKKALATMGKWQSFVRKKKVLTKGRRAGFAGRLPIRKGSGASNRNKDDQKEKQDPKTLGRFRAVVKLVIYLLRLSRTYIYKESDARMVSLFSDIDAARAGDHYKIRGDLLYDVTEYKALKSQKISKDTKRILLMDHKKRSKKDIHHVMVELQQMKGITKYPVDMQRGLVTNSWYEEYPTGRVIIRYGRSPQAFYVILGGSALHLEGDPNIPGRHVSSLNKGDMFGEQAIAHQNKHVYTVISKEAIQLMCLAPDDYSRIFLAGGLGNFSDLGEKSFVRSICIFKHWPIHLLKDNHTQTRFQYFVHGTTIVEDSTKSEWIIIVKSGSCSVLKKLVDPTQYGKPAIAPVSKRKKSVVPTTRYKRDFIQPAETHQEMLTRKLKELQKRRSKSIKNSRWKRYIKKPTNLLKIPLHDDPFEEPHMSEDYRGKTDPIAADMHQRYEESWKASRLKPTDMSRNPDLTEANTSGVSTTEEGADNEGDQRDETGEEPMDTSGTSHHNHVMGGRKQSFAKGPFMTHRSAGIRPVCEPNKTNDSGTTSTRNNNGGRRDSIAQSEGDVPKKIGSTRTDGALADGLTRRNSLARRDSVIQRRGSMIRRDNQALMETNDGDGRESVTQDSGMTDLTEATQYEQGASPVAGKDDEVYESEDDDEEEGQTEAPPEPVHTFLMIDTLEKGGVFGVLDMAFGSQSSLSLVSNGAECIMVNKKFFKKHSNEKTIWNIGQMFRPYPDEDTLTKDLKEKLTWKDHRDVTLKETALKFKKTRKRLTDPRLQRPSTIVESFS